MANIQQGINQLLTQGGIMLGIGTKLYQDSPQGQAKIKTKQAQKAEDLASKLEATGRTPKEQMEFTGEGIELRQGADKLRNEAFYANPTQELFTARQQARTRAEAAKGRYQDLHQQVTEEALKRAEYDRMMHPDEYEGPIASVKPALVPKGPTMEEANQVVKEKGLKQIKQKNTFEKLKKSLADMPTSLGRFGDLDKALQKGILDQAKKEGTLESMVETERDRLKRRKK